MRSGREELRRGVRDLIETASREMDALAEPPAPPPPVPVPTVNAAPPRVTPPPAAPAADQRPILRLVRDVTPSPAPPAVSPAAPIDLTAAASRKGVCSAYYANPKCWEVADAFCNRALHVCMLRECPVYHLNREQLEQRFARKFAHLW